MERKEQEEINIRERMKEFLLKDVIRPSLEPEYLKHIQNSILILDKGTQKIVNSCVKMIDLVEVGIVGNFFLILDFDKLCGLGN